jgi:hypothetical protein
MVSIHSLPLRKDWIDRMIRELELDGDQKPEDTLMEVVRYSDLSQIVEPCYWLKNRGIETIPRLESDFLVQLEDYLDIGKGLSEQLESLNQENQRQVVQIEETDHDHHIDTSSRKLCKYWVSQGFTNDKGEKSIFPMICIDHDINPLVPGVKILIKSGTKVLHGIICPTIEETYVLGGGWIRENDRLEFTRKDRIEMLKARQETIKASK